MAALAILPVVATAVQLVLPLIPGAIAFAEQTFGGGNGDQKKQTVVDLLKSGLTAVANAGKIPSAGVIDPSLPAALGDAVQKTFDAISVNGKIPAVLPAAKPVPTNLAASIVSGAGRTFMVIEVS